MSAPLQPQSGLPAASVQALIATGTVCATASLVISALPAIVNALTSAGLFDPAKAGYVVAVDLAGQVAGTLLFMSQSRRLPWSASLSIGLTLMVIGNLLSCFTPSTPVLIATRLVAGIGAGIARSACFAVFARARNPARAVALLVAAQIVTMSGAFAAFPWVTRAVGWVGPYLSLSVLGLLMFATAPWWPRQFRLHHAAPISLLFGRSGAVCLAATFLYFLAQAGVWAFIQAIGSAVGESSAFISSALAFVAIPGIAASLLASVVSVRVSIPRALIVGLCLTLAALYLLTIDAGSWIFGLGLGLFYFAWCGTVPFQFASAAASDRSGNTASAFPAADGLGLAAGPAVAGTMLVEHGTLTVIILAAFCTAFSIALFVAATGQGKRLGRLTSS